MFPDGFVGFGFYFFPCLGSRIRFQLHDMFCGFGVSDTKRFQPFSMLHFPCTILMKNTPPSTQTTNTTRIVRASIIGISFPRSTPRRDLLPLTVHLWIY